MRIVLVDMPWSSIDAPSLALAVLKRRVLDVFPDAEVDVIHGNLDYIDWVADRVGFSFEEYDAYVSSYFSGHSEWIFSAALNEQPRWKVAEFTELLGGKLPEPIVAKARELHELAPLSPPGSRRRNRTWSVSPLRSRRTPPPSRPREQSRHWHPAR
jgi:hypothetical protein